MKIILAINAGSSSVKISAYSCERGQKKPTQLAEAQLSGLTSAPAKLRYSRRKVTVYDGKEVQPGVERQEDAFNVLLNTLVEDGELGEISDRNDIDLACHRVVHGGDYTTPQRISDETYDQLKRLTDLAPLHNSSALGIVKACMAELPRAINVAYFDSQFHASIPDHVRTYPIDPVVAAKNQLRKYGFHGISYQFITTAVAAFLAKDARELNIIALHLGSGASACAIKAGRSWDTSMGLTPLAGLPGATRSGSVDPSLVFHYASDVGRLSPHSTRDLHISRAEEILNKESGWKALTGTTDFGLIARSAEAPHRLAFDLMVDRVCGFVGAYYVSLAGRVDALVFAGGVGERSARLRAEVGHRLACLGFGIDADLNERDDDEDDDDDDAVVVRDVSSAAAAHRILVCRTDEQFEMARAVADGDGELWT